MKVEASSLDSAQIYDLLYSETRDALSIAFNAVDVCDDSRLNDSADTVTLTYAGQVVATVKVDDESRIAILQKLERIDLVQ